MKPRFYNSVILSMLLIAYCSQSIQAIGRGSSDINHAIAVAAQGGYAMPIGNYNGVTFSHSSDWQIQLCYELNSDKFLFQVGVGCEYSRAHLNAADYFTAIDAFDTQGTAFTYACQFTNRIDNASAVSVSVPLLVGCQVSHFYFLAGAIGSMVLYQQNKAFANLTCWGSYDRYVEDFTQMDNHAFYTNEPVSEVSKEAHRWPRFQVRPHLELGVQFTSFDITNGGYRSSNQQGVLFRLAAYTEYGALNAQSNPEYQQPYIIDKSHPYDVNTIGIPPVFNTQHYAGTYLSDLTIGLRLSITFNMQTSSRRCKTCTY